jgi:hypothetical protein
MQPIPNLHTILVLPPPVEVFYSINPLVLMPIKTALEKFHLVSCNVSDLMASSISGDAR